MASVSPTLGKRPPQDDDGGGGKRPRQDAAAAAADDAIVVGDSDDDDNNPRAPAGGAAGGGGGGGSDGVAASHSPAGAGGGGDDDDDHPLPPAVHGRKRPDPFRHVNIGPDGAPIVHQWGNEREVAALVDAIIARRPPMLPANMGPIVRQLLIALISNWFSTERSARSKAEKILHNQNMLTLCFDPATFAHDGHPLSRDQELWMRALKAEIAVYMMRPFGSFVLHEKTLRYFRDALIDFKEPLLPRFPVRHCNPTFDVTAEDVVKVKKFLIDLETSDRFRHLLDMKISSDDTQVGTINEIFVKLEAFEIDIELLGRVIDVFTKSDSVDDPVEPST